jgi:hypothetical protein
MYQWGETPLHMACHYPDVVSLLLHHGADVHLKDQVSHQASSIVSCSHNFFPLTHGPSGNTPPFIVLVSKAMKKSSSLCWIEEHWETFKMRSHSSLSTSFFVTHLSNQKTIFGRKITWTNTGCFKLLVRIQSIFRFDILSQNFYQYRRPLLAISHSLRVHPIVPTPTSAFVPSRSSRKVIEISDLVRFLTEYL